MANKQLGTRHSEELLESIAQKAKELGISFSELVDQVLTSFDSFDIAFIKTIKGVSENFGLSAAGLIQGFLCVRLAKLDARIETYGTDDELSMDTLTQGDFKADYLMHRKAEAERLEREIAVAALEKEQDGTEELEPYEKELLIKYRMGRAWLESEQHQKELEMKRYIEEKYPDAVKLNREYQQRMKAEAKARRSQVDENE